MGIPDEGGDPALSVIFALGMGPMASIQMNVELQKAGGCLIPRADTLHIIHTWQGIHL